MTTLICPTSGSVLRPMAGDVVQQINVLIAAGEIKGDRDHVVMEPVDGLLKADDGNLAYPLRHGIPQLLPQLTISHKGLITVNSFE